MPDTSASGSGNRNAMTGTNPKHPHAKKMMK